MSDPVGDPWLTLIGLGEDGLGGLSDASRKALEDAEQVFGGERHLALCQAGARGQVWPLPFSVAPVVALRGRPVVVLASGDPFWHGVGGSLAQHLDPAEWRCFPAPSCLSLAAARLGWRLETVASLGLHAAPFESLRPHLSNGRRILCTLRDGLAAAEIAAWLTAQGFGASELIVMEALGGPHERVRTCTAAQFTLSDVGAPVVAGIAVNGKPGLSQTAGREADIFAHDGQITKGPMRALTLAALAPRAGQRLWDIGAGSGSVSVEWALAAADARAIAMEPRADRCANIRENAARFGLSHRITIVEGTAPAALADLPVPDAVFIGGGVNADLLSNLWDMLPEQTRLVANAVTLESQALLTGWHGQYGGQLLRIDLAQATPLGQMRGWTPSHPQVQWSVVR
jgi:precorrin-6Y C5,15-methyltransferase (decarboxylating)